MSLMVANDGARLTLRSSRASPPAPPAAAAVIAGLAQVRGDFDLVTGAFQASSTTITGTGLLRHVTGDVSIAGTENLTTGSFTEELIGTLCLD